MWIKICGIRDAASARAVARCSPNAIGLNFYADSPRAVGESIAAEIVSRLPGDIEPVGLFVNETADAIDTICRSCGLRTIQLHGDEGPDVVAELTQRHSEYRIIRAWHFGPGGLKPLAEYLRELERLGAAPAACLIDAHVGGIYGGSGRTVPWDRLADEYNRHEWPPMILAGGLGPENVAEAIRACRPWGVDVAGGVESAPGRKDVKRVEAFISAARRAFAMIESGTPRSSPRSG